MEERSGEGDMIRCLVPKEMVEEVAIFQIGEGFADTGKWVVRCFNFGQLGDGISDEKPTEQELRDFFENPNLIITDHYEIVSQKFLQSLTEAQKEGIGKALLKNLGFEL